MTSATVGSTPFALVAREARDMMTPSPVCVFASDPIESAAELLGRYSAVAVVDHDRRVVGVLARSDLARVYGAMRSVTGASLSLESRVGEDQSGLDWKPPAKRVAEVMTPRVVTVKTDTPATEVVKHLSDRRIGRLFVVDGDQALVGVISTTDVIMRLRPA
ncbi:MAG: CBS domain-containing protein [Myxococcota bacterium]